MSTAGEAKLREWARETCVNLGLDTCDSFDVDVTANLLALKEKP